MAEIRRVEINLGWACNNRCVFCAEQERREHAKQVGRFLIPKEEVLRDLAAYRREGFDHVTFLGGEPSIRKDIVELVRTARELGYRGVLMTTNGCTFGNRRFLRTLLRAGLTDICISIHGPDAETHDDLTARPGSFAATEQALLNLVLERKSFHTSTVVTTRNAAKLETLVRYLHQYRPAHILLALPNASGGALRRFASLYPAYPDVAPHVHAALDAARELDQIVTVARLPYCHLVGREGYADELFWGEGVQREIDPRLDQRIEQRFGYRTVHGLACGQCRYRFVCEGVELAYVERRGTDDLVPVAGDPVEDLGELRRNRHFKKGMS